MRMGTAHGPGWAVRRLTLGSGPLKRGTDRVQVLSRIVLLAAVVAAAPIALWSANLTHEHLTSVAAAQEHSRHATRAVLLRDAEQWNAPSLGWGSATDVLATAPARWITVLGTARTGTVDTPDGARAGASVPIWTADDGSLTTAPPDRQDVTSESVATALATFAGIGLAALGGHYLVCWLLARRRDRQWTAGWASVAPVWGRQPL